MQPTPAFNWKSALLAGTLAGLGAIVVVLLLDRLRVEALFEEIQDYLHKQDEFRARFPEPAPPPPVPPTAPPKEEERDGA